MLRATPSRTTVARCARRDASPSVEARVRRCSHASMPTSGTLAATSVAASVA